MLGDIPDVVNLVLPSGYNIQASVYALDSLLVSQGGGASLSQDSGPQEKSISASPTTADVRVNESQTDPAGSSKTPTKAVNPKQVDPAGATQTPTKAVRQKEADPAGASQTPTKAVQVHEAGAGPALPGAIQTRSPSPSDHWSPVPGPWTGGLVRWVGRQLVLNKYWDTLGPHVEAEEGKVKFGINMTKHYISESWLSNVVMAAFANEFQILFLNLTPSPAQAPGKKNMQLTLTERSQIMPREIAPGCATTSIYTLWSGDHFDRLIIRPESDPRVDCEWDQEASSTYFQRVRAPKDGACGYNVLAAALNENGTQVPLEFQEPTDRY